MKPPVQVAIVGANGYTGGELLRLLAVHPGVEVCLATSRSQAAEPLSACFPALAGAPGLPETFVDADAAQVAAACTTAFTCLPHRESQQWVADLVKAGCQVIDLSADFRYNDVRVYERAYVPHSEPELAARAVYGLPEINRAAIKGADLVAVPGCYPTSVLLPLLPLARENAISGRVTVDSQSGVSGAGRSAGAALLHGEVSESLRAYGLPCHRHESEMAYQLEALGGLTLDVMFTPHLAPINRGILSTIHVELTGRADDTRELLRSAWAHEPFVTLLPEGQLPKTDSVRGSNRVQVQLVPRRGNIATLISAIDNLCKGASGQAIQNFNLMHGLAETTGLDGLGVAP